MNVMVVGNGGREHALVNAVKSGGHEVIAVPGREGYGVRTVHVRPTVSELIRVAKEESVGLTVIGSETLLCEGVSDAFAEAGLTCVGPSRSDAELEGSKIACAQLLQDFGVPVPRFVACDSVAEARRATFERLLEWHDIPVAKLDRLHAGKGVVVPENAEAIDRGLSELDAMRSPGEQIMVQERKGGREVSAIAMTDGETVLPLGYAQDFKRLREGDRGPNTGGMASYAPVPFVTPALEGRIMDEIFLPIVRGMATRGRTYRGVLYAGLMVGRDRELSVLEINVRPGDPETQVLLPRLSWDSSTFVDVLLATTRTGALKEHAAPVATGAAACIVMAAAGYPGKPVTGTPIPALGTFADRDVIVYHAGTKLLADGLYDGVYVTDSGRVLGVTCLASEAKEAAACAYGAVQKLAVGWQGVQYRNDIRYRMQAMEQF